MRKMRALVKYDYGINKMELREVVIPEPDPEEVRIRIKAVGVCGTDLKIQDDQFFYNPPVIMGHEFAGIIDKPGHAVEGWQRGDRIVSEQHLKACGLCSYCLNGKRHFCAQKKSPGYMIDGAFAEYICVSASLLHKIPERVTLEQATLIEPMAVAAQGILHRSGISPEDFVVILGCGSIAILAMQIVKAQGASRVLMTGLPLDEKIRFEVARKLGADILVNVQNEDPVQVVMNESDQMGANLVIDLAGNSEAILQGMVMLRKGGKFCALGLPHGEIAVPWTKILLRAIDLNFSFSSGYTSWEQCISMVNNRKVKLDDYTAHLYPLEDWQKAFEIAKSGDALKVIIKP